MKTLITALSFSALLVGGSAAQAMTDAPNLTPGERAEIQRLVPQVTSLNQLTERQVRALSDLVANSNELTHHEARQTALDIIREQPWLLPSRPGAR